MSFVTKVSIVVFLVLLTLNNITIAAGKKCYVGENCRRWSQETCDQLCRYEGGCAELRNTSTWCSTGYCWSHWEFYCESNPSKRAGEANCADWDPSTCGGY